MEISSLICAPQPPLLSRNVVLLGCRPVPQFTGELRPDIKCPGVTESVGTQIRLTLPPSDSKPTFFPMYPTPYLQATVGGGTGPEIAPSPSLTGSPLFSQPHTHFSKMRVILGPCAVVFLLLPAKHVRRLGLGRGVLGEQGELRLCF